MRWTATPTFCSSLQGYEALLLRSSFTPQQSDLLEKLLVRANRLCSPESCIFPCLQSVKLHRPLRCRRDSSEENSRFQQFATKRTERSVSGLNILISRSLQSIHWKLPRCFHLNQRLKMSAWRGGGGGGIVMNVFVKHALKLISPVK